MTTPGTTRNDVDRDDTHQTSLPVLTIQGINAQVTSSDDPEYQLIHAEQDAILPNVRWNINYEDVQPKMGWLPIEVIKRTFASTTQLAKCVRDRIPL
jgi:hypothetical protein